MEPRYRMIAGLFYFRIINRNYGMNNKLKCQQTKYGRIFVRTTLKSEWCVYLHL